VISDHFAVHSPLGLVLGLIIAHFLGDFALQSSAMARGKVPGGDPHVAWGWWLCSHASTHAFLVMLLTGSWVLSVAEWGTHAWIDHAKINRQITFTVDQALHLGLKLVWAALALSA